MVTAPVTETRDYSNPVDAVVCVRSVCVFGLITTRLGKPPSNVLTFGGGLGRQLKSRSPRYTKQMKWASSR